MQMPQLVGIPHHIDRRDLSVFDFECGRLEFTIGFQCHETLQSVDETGTNQLRAAFWNMVASDSCSFMTAS